MDELDISEEREQIARDDAIRAVRKAAGAFDPGCPGECGKCGEQSLRLVNDWCARCRDKYRRYV